MKNPLKYRPLVNQVELNYWNPQPNLITVRPTAPYSLKLPSPVCRCSVGKVTEGVIRSFIAVRRHEEGRKYVGVTDRMCQLAYPLHPMLTHP